MPATTQKQRKSKLSNEIAAYGVAEASRILRIAPATLRSWVVGREYVTDSGPAFFSPPIRLPDSDSNLLSFLNLVEAHILMALRVEHNVPLRDVRSAIKYAEREMGITRLLLHRDLRTTLGELFLDKYGELVNLSRSGQLAMRKILESHLRRIEWETAEFPIRLFPLTGQHEMDTKRIVSISPNISFGRPVIHSVGISTSAIVSRIDAGESPNSVARDYGISRGALDAAILFEKAA
jgi:uncharacterized protein (DUF433 family)